MLLGLVQGSDELHVLRTPAKPGTAAQVSQQAPKPAWQSSGPTACLPSQTASTTPSPTAIRTHPPPGDGPEMNGSTPSLKRLQGLYLAAALLRLVLFFAFPGLPELVAGRVEVSTPVTSFKRCMSPLSSPRHA